MGSCFVGLMIDTNKLLLISVSLSLSVLTLFLLKRFKLSTKMKISVIYGHLSFLFFPLVLLTTDTACGVLCMSCYNSIIHLIVYALPTTLLLSTMTGFIVIPTLYIFSSKKTKIENKQIIDFVKKFSKKFKIKTPKLFIIDKVTPLAFSFRSFKSAIFLSAGLIDILNKKEIESVLLHELAHIKNKSSIIKFSSLLLRLFSPLSILARFHHDSDNEEKRADDFVIRIQKTKKHLLSAKSKINMFNKLKR